MLKFYSLLFAGLAVLSVIGFVGFAAWCGAKEAATILKKLWKSWRGRQVSSAKDRIKRVVRVLVLFALTSSASATLNTSQEVIGPHKNWTPVSGPPVIVKFSTDYTGPTATPTPTFTWNATTTRTQPPTSTPTATNTPINVEAVCVWTVVVTPGWTNRAVTLDGTYKHHIANSYWGASRGGTYGAGVTLFGYMCQLGESAVTVFGGTSSTVDVQAVLRSDLNQMPSSVISFYRSYASGATPTPGTGVEFLAGTSWDKVGP